MRLKFECCRQKVVDFLDLTLVKDPIYMNLAMGVSFVLYSDTAFFTLQPLYLFELGFSKVTTSSHRRLISNNFRTIFIQKFYRSDRCGTDYSHWCGRRFGIANFHGYCSVMYSSESALCLFSWHYNNNSHSI